MQNYFFYDRISLLDNGIVTLYLFGRISIFYCITLMVTTSNLRSYGIFLYACNTNFISELSIMRQWKSLHDNLINMPQILIALLDHSFIEPPTRSHFWYANIIVSQLPSVHTTGTLIAHNYMDLVQYCLSNISSVRISCHFTDVDFAIWWYYIQRISTSIFCKVVKYNVLPETDIL